MEDYIVENINPCEPITNLLNYLTSRGYKIHEKKLSDYHFNEFFYSLSGILELNKSDFDEISKMKDIKLVSPKEFCCTCHWSIVKIN